MKKVALLATGDEIIQGDVLNTNAAHIAEALTCQGISVGNHLVASDYQADILEAMKYLLAHHSALITIGGLGPTSDDRTRYALAEVLQETLIFDESSWQMIVNRLKKLRLAVPDTNKQQCLFPQQAEIFPNTRGTANACKVKYQDKLIYMLPGPPNECLPIFHQHVINDLKQADFSIPHFRASWLLLGVSESAIADALDPLINPEEITLGYRVSFPYLEIKLAAFHQTILEHYRSLVDPLIQCYTVSHHKQTASQQLEAWIQNHNEAWYFDDGISKGLLQYLLISPKTAKKIYFCPVSMHPDRGCLSIKLRGLKYYWAENMDESADEILLTINKKLSSTLSTPVRTHAMLERAIETICWEILNHL